MDLRYHGKSGLRELAWGAAMTFEPNLSRSRVFFDGEIVDPLRFREAISALHEVVIGDLRFKKKDRSAHTAWLAVQAQQEKLLSDAIHDKVKQAEIAKIAKEPLPANLEADFRKMHRVYWDARVRWAHELSQNDPELFRHLVPCDPVVTVAPDVVMFECFAKDEASYGCLSVDRDAFKTSDDGGIGTTNVDYSLALFDHFQTIRSYRPTRLLVDPAGFEVAVSSGGSTLREEQINLPGSWLRGFGQLQAAMALPARRVELSTDVVYSILAYMRRHREKTGPRSVKFVLEPGKPPIVVLEPWGVTLTSRGRLYDGPKAEEIKVWGRRRLMAFARALPFAERFDVQLLGTGLPSVWTARLGPMRLTLALSGWTANDWSRGSNLDEYFAGFTSSASAIESLTMHLMNARSATLAQLVTTANEDPEIVLGSLHQLAKRGQLAYDFASGVYRWRPILDVALTDAMLGPEPDEVVAGRALVSKVKIERSHAIAGTKRLLVGKVGGGGGEKPTACEAVVDSDGAFANAKCTCSYFYRFKLRAGPCRHLLALRLFAATGAPPTAAAPVAPAVSVPGTTPPPATPANPAAVPPPVPPPLAATGMSRHALALQLTMVTARAISQGAAQARVDGGEIIARAWRDARVVVQTWRDSTRVPPIAAPKSPYTFQIDDRVIAELQAEAARLDVSISNLFEAAWRATRTGSGGTDTSRMN